MKNKEIVYGVIGLVIGVIITLVFTNSHTNYGMMSSNTGMMGSSSTTPSSQKVAQIKQEEQEGQTLLQQFQAQKLTCTTLTQDNFEKIGDYVMRQRVGSSEKHAIMDANMTQMMGDNQNTQMHISLGENATGCVAPTQATSNSTMPMMGH